MILKAINNCLFFNRFVDVDVVDPDVYPEDYPCFCFTSREFLPDGVEQSHLVRRQLEAAVQRSTGSQRQREEQGQRERRC